MPGNGAIQPSAEMHPATLSSPPREAEDSALTSTIPCIPDPRCCCGNISCAFLIETQIAFDRLDDSLRTAGRLGKALLVRHEEYVAEAEADKQVLRHEIEQLTMDKQLVQSKNNDLIEENRLLLEQLESANNAVTDSDTHIKSLQSTLTSAQEELNKLNSLSRRTEALERELEQFEHEQSSLQASLTIKTEEEKAATLRWQTAERTLMSLEDRIEAIENEAKAERERHVEVIGRMERRRVIESELDTSAGRLKAAAASKTTTDKHGSGVISHFVKDILQDNANLQSSVLELKELLMVSNEEMEKLREQVNQHLVPVDLSEELTPRKPKKNLGEEMAKQNAQAVHVHHHYHAPTAKPDPVRRQSQMLRRPSKKKRPGVSFSSFTPPSGYQTPRNASVNSFAFPTPLSTATTLAADSPSVQNLAVGNHRWSMMSSQPPSSVPSSPQSDQNSLFDRSFSDSGLGIDSRPTTPATDIESPFFGASQSKRMSSASYFRPLDDVLLEYDSPDESPSENTKPAVPAPSPAPAPETNKQLMPEEDEEIEHSLVDFKAQVPQPRTPQKVLGRPMSFTEDDLPPNFNQTLHTPLRRSASHESLLSVSGMDIHTLKTRPGQMLTGLSTMSGRSYSSKPVVSAATAHAARPALTPIVQKSSHHLLTGMAADPRTVSSPAANQGFGKRVGGWMFGRWGNTQPTSAGTSLSNLNPARTRSGGEVAPQEITTLTGARITVTDYDDLYDDDEDDDQGDYSDDESCSSRSAESDQDEVLEGAHSPVSGRGSPASELERMLEDLDEDDPKRKSIEREFNKVMEENLGQFGVGVFG